MIPASDLLISLNCAPNFIVDSNVAAGPTTSADITAAYITAQITNTGTDPIADVTLNIGDYNIGDFSNSTPGVYPVNVNPPTFTGSLSLQHQGGTIDAVRYVGTLAPGQTATHYWLVSYPLFDANGRPTFGDHADNSDDLVLEYDVWATGTDSSVAITETVTKTATMREEISSSANKIWPNTTAKVPDEYLAAFGEQLGWQLDQTAPSVARTKGIWYDFGHVNQGFDADANLVPDYDVWSQPVGDPTPQVFDASAWRLVHSYGILIVSLNDGTEQVIAFEDELYHKDLPANNTGVVGLVYYEFAPIGFGPGQLSPYQEAASGSNNEKFNGDYDTFVGGPEGNPPTADFDKSGPATVLPNTTITYDLTVTNTGTVPFGLNDYGVPAVISDVIPVGTQYVRGSAAVVTPLPNGITAQILYSIDNGIHYTTTEPGQGVTITNLQWVLSAPLPVEEGVTVRFATSVPADYTQSQVYNTGGVGLGNTRPLYVDNVNSLVTGSNAISGVVFRDNGAGGGTTGDGIRQVGETTFLGNITVTLYPDADGDGVVDASEAATPRTTTVSTSGTGAWSFGSLPNGKYIVEVRRDDPDRPTGDVLSTTETFAVTVSGGDQSGFAFGFAPTLDVDKTVITPTPLIEGTLVTYGIDITNLLKPDSFVAPLALNGNVFYTNGTAALNYVPPDDGTPLAALFSSLAAAPTEVAFDESNNKVYLAYTSGLIESRNVDGTGIVTIATGQGAGISGLAVDAVHGFVYWTSRAANTINRRNFDGTGTITTLTGLNNPEGVAVDPLNATVYWL